MSTIYLIDRETALTAPAADDLYVIHDTSAGVVKKITHADVNKCVVTFASSASQTITNNGLTVISTSGGTSHTLSAPEAGIIKYLVSTTAATATTVTVNMPSTSVTVNAVGTSIVFNGKYTAVTLVGESATQWHIVSTSLGADSGATITLGTS